MITSNNWLKSNILEYVRSSTVDFKVWFDLYPFKIMSFREATDLTVQSIAKDFWGRPLYIALSGGADSEYVFRSFVRSNVPITPIIIETPMNITELQYASRVLRELNIKPIVIKVSESELTRYFLETIHTKLKSMALNSSYSLIATQHVNSVGGVMVNGDHIINDDGTIVCNEFEFFPNNVIYKDCIGFYYYTLELCYAMVKQIKANEPVADYKTRVYNTSWRPKFYPIYSDTFSSIYSNLPKPRKGVDEYEFGTPTEFLARLENENT
jgi:hypothetical protein